jgi:hypothetical protein
MNNTSYYNEFVNFETDYLITLRARGEELNEEAHAAIEKIASERGEKLPPKPNHFMDIKIEYGKKKESKFLNGTGNVLLVIFALIGGEIGREFIEESPLVGLLISMPIVAFFGYKFLKRKINKEEKAKYEKQKEIENKGLTELMVCAADGELDKLRDLVNYKKVDLNRTCFGGSTALMYAVRNNHFEIAKILIENGADISVKNRSSQTALSIAQKYASEEIKALFQQ